MGLRAPVKVLTSLLDTTRSSQNTTGNEFELRRSYMCRVNFTTKLQASVPRVEAKPLSRKQKQVVKI